jgi:hypothetical protein
MSRIETGRVIVIDGSPYTVVRRERGRAVYVVRRVSDGHEELRSRASLLRYI